MTRRRAVWLLLSRRPRLIVPRRARPLLTPLAVAAAAVAVVLAVFVLVDIPLNVFVLGAVALIAAGASVIGGAGARQGESDVHLLRRDTHADLYALVADVARELRLQPPRRVMAWASPDARATRGFLRTELWLGLPLLAVLDEEELRAVVAHELVLERLSRPWPTGGLLTLYWTEVSRAEAGAEPLGELGPLVDSLMLQADQAGVRVAGSEATTSALSKGLLVANGFTWFMLRYARDLVTERFFPSDLYAGWRWKLQHDDLAERMWPGLVRADAGDERPGASMSRRVAALGGVLTIPRPPERVLFTALPGEVEERFTRQALSRYLPKRYVLSRKTRYGDVPDGAWDRHHERERDEVLAAAAALLGKDVADPLDAVEIVVAGRAPELEWNHAFSFCAHPGREVCVLFPLIHCALRASGHDYGHPLRQRELRAPTGEVVDVTGLAVRFLDGGSAKDDFRALLTSL
ncbi:M48 family metallopeptidase [Planotetraspora kaengkrachanensis]|nr:M48 family metallopeptidase [Planotetraspora kaengkrachanensis]